jgi:hypothetical protein
MGRTTTNHQRKRKRGQADLTHLGPSKGSVILDPECASVKLERLRWTRPHAYGCDP